MNTIYNTTVIHLNLLDRIRVLFGASLQLSLQIELKRTRTDYQVTNTQSAVLVGTPKPSCHDQQSNEGDGASDIAEYPLLPAECSPAAAGEEAPDTHRHNSDGYQQGESLQYSNHN